MRLRKILQPPSFLSAAVRGAELGRERAPFWFDESLLASLRQNVSARIRKLDLLSEASKQNPFGQEILAQIDEANQTRKTLKPWLALSWRHFLYWFADIEGRLSRGETKATDLLTLADANWSKVDKAKVLMEERENTGTWIRSWLNTLHEYEAD